MVELGVVGIGLDVEPGVGEGWYVIRAEGTGVGGLVRGPCWIREYGVGFGFNWECGESPAVGVEIGCLGSGWVSRGLGIGRGVVTWVFWDMSAVVSVVRVRALYSWVVNWGWEGFKETDDTSEAVVQMVCGVGNLLRSATALMEEIGGGLT